MQTRHPWLSAVIIPAPLVRMNLTISYRLNAAVKVGTKNEIGPAPHRSLLLNYYIVP
ncbi:hypothetical protein C7475_108275 [Chitinophaga sp. S165]|nr:hypothetical protein C7475_108275 [Chitinophaga sp. S165]